MLPSELHASTPTGRVVMRPVWHHLLFLHWPVPAQQVQALLPPGLEVETFGGSAWVGLVPFAMAAVRPHFVPPLGPLGPLTENFLELNVRTYVRCQGIPGVWFFSLDAANAAAVIVARSWFHLPYFKARMRFQRRGPGGWEYASRRQWPRPLPATLSLRYEVFGPAAPAQIGTLEHFLVERYVLYSSQNGNLYRGRVWHKPYLLQNARVLRLRENCVAACGLEVPRSEPHAVYSRGVNVDVFAMEKVASVG